MQLSINYNTIQFNKHLITPDVTDSNQNRIVKNVATALQTP